VSTPTAVHDSAAPRLREIPPPPIVVAMPVRAPEPPPVATPRAEAPVETPPTVNPTRPAHAAHGPPRVSRPTQSVPQTTQNPTPSPSHTAPQAGIIDQME
jgi:hypothetical protein